MIYRSMLHVSRQSGFTLVEMIVAMGLFAVVVTITGGALITLISTNQRFHYEQNIMSNIGFALDSMTREIRSGYNYHCLSADDSDGTVFDDTGTEHEGLDDTEHDCTQGRRKTGSANFPIHGISVIESGDNLTTGTGETRVLYFYDANHYDAVSGITGHGALLRRIGNRASEALTSEGVVITDANFFVSGTDATLATGDDQQASVTIFVSARATDDTDAVPKEYQVQTTITQRSLDL
jgi:prepilin-type N-terminal cleavage/methylation domain-containing protein